MVEEYKVEVKSKNPKKPIMQAIDYDIPWGFFDGACQGLPLVCGVGVVLFMSQNHYIHI